MPAAVTYLRFQIRSAFLPTVSLCQFVMCVHSRKCFSPVNFYHRVTVHFHLRHIPSNVIDTAKQGRVRASMGHKGIYEKLLFTISGRKHQIRNNKIQMNIDKTTLTV